MSYFNLTPETTPESLRNQYWELAKKLHPDAGGDKEQFQLLQQEYEDALKELGQRDEYKFLLTDSETFKGLLNDTDKMLAKLGLKPLNEILTDKAMQLIDNIKLPPSLKILESLKPMAKMQVAEKMSDPASLAMELEKFIRQTVKKSKK